jgi:hypothetical protein
MSGEGQHLTSNGSRRNFLKRAALATLAAVPALQALATQGAEAAEKGHCLEQYCKMTDSWCSCGRYTIEMTCYCAICMGYCSMRYDDGGPC